MYIKTGDTVAVIAGRDQFVTDKKGTKTRKTGRVLKVLKSQDRVVVEGVNVVKKHQRPTQANDKGGIIEVEAPIHVSNVALLDPKSGEPTKVGFRVENGKKVRFARKSGTTIDSAKK
ncbi:50S ribosomal protein L24 [Alteracholeplasma palmae J233]|uniref:Large ribosomal subunit protein uL24 n=1 Tax=Alteracholeplasma palmae (strain ATCC 49389 / J233) TaxID=1318466 RepID=U4KSD5_ALTPJ|nr:50S ribosomal protein L24 [Alteracholeplasma palmae]CCV64916.1 50S ribosomal protein L24 [Alteracholeplasma palmae J233]